MEQEKNFDGDEEYVPLVIWGASAGQVRLLLAVRLDEFRADSPAFRRDGYRVSHGAQGCR